MTNAIVTGSNGAIVPQGTSRNTDRARAQLASAMEAGAVPGLQYLVVDVTGAVFEYDGGWADIRCQRPMRAETTMMAYSMSKTITAVAVLQLVGAGTVGLDDPLSRHVERSPYGPAVTVRHLLSHTSGVPNPIPLRWVHLANRHAEFDGGAAFDAVLRRHGRLAFEPGAKYAYSNIGYWLLGRVVERASGERFESYVGRHVIERLGLSPGDMAFAVTDPAHHASGYLERFSVLNLARPFLIDRDLAGDYAGRWLEIRSHYVNGPAFGGLVGTARGFGAFLRDQLRERSALLDETTRPLLYAPQQTTRGKPVGMTLGWHIDDRQGIRAFFKEGGGGGFHCMMRLYPHAGIGTVMMTNATAFDIGRLMRTVDTCLTATAPPTVA
ncbi:MAG: beta-lactamase family protein [Acidobacteriota bacterium]|nr:beta-lactamase family protein [Acidobacteriota bacterium]